MNPRALLFLSVVAVALCAVDAVSIDHDKVQPFLQPEPVTAFEKDAIDLKPKLQIRSGCHPYPAVNAAGETSGGLKATGSRSGDCKGSSLGSQVYGRATQYKNMLAFMYTWYFPKDNGMWGFVKGHRHSWLNVVVWFDDPEKNSSTGPGVSFWAGLKDIPYVKHNNMISLLMDVTHLRVAQLLYGWKGVGLILSSTMAEGGDFQDLIMWEQLTDEARRALNETDFGEDAVPFIDANFMTNLEKAWPFE